MIIWKMESRSEHFLFFSPHALPILLLEPVIFSKIQNDRETNISDPKNQYQLIAGYKRISYSAHLRRRIKTKVPVREYSKLPPTQQKCSNFQTS